MKAHAASNTAASNRIAQTWKKSMPGVPHTTRPVAQRYVSGINVAWAIMRSKLDALYLGEGGSEALETGTLANSGLIGSPLTRLHPVKPERVGLMR